MLALFVALAAAGVTHAQRPGFIPVTTDGLIVGQVVDAVSGRAVSGAVVSLGGTLTVQQGSSSIRITGTTAPRRGLTSRDGYFVFRDLPRGDFTITAAKPGFADAAYGRRRPNGPSQQLSLTAEPRREIVLRMWRHGAINGAVTDEIGEPLIGIAVQSFRRTETGGVRRYVPSQTATTDDRGVYRLSNLSPGDYIVAASSRQVAVPLALARDDRDLRATPTPDTALVAVPRPGSASALQLGDSVYALPPNGPTPPPPEDGRLSVYPPTFHPAAASALETLVVTLRPGEEREGIDLHLRPVRTVRVGGALNGPANMLAMRRLRLVPAGNDVIEASELVTSTDARGAFVFPAVPPGDYALKTTTRDVNWRGEPERALHWADVPLTVGPEDMDDVEVVLRPGLIVSGALAFDGAARRPYGNLQRVPIAIERASSSLPGGETVANAIVDDTGRFSTMGVPAGSYYVRVTDSPIGWMFKGAMFKGRDLSEFPIELGDDVDGISIEFTDRWTGIRGIVTTPSVQVDDAALVILFPTDSSRWRTSAPVARRLRSTRVRTNGEFSFASVPTGEYYITAIGDEDGADWQDPGFLDVASRSAARITINDGDQKMITLRRKDTRQ